VKARLDCIVCVAKQTLKASRMATSDLRIQEKILRKVLRRLSEAEWNNTPLGLGRELQIFKIIRKYTGVEDPYLDVKKRSNEEALQLLPWVRKVVQESDDPLRASVLVSIAGNIIDAATVDEYDLKATILETLETKPRIDHYELLKEDVKGAETLLYFADNAGEIVFDRLLIEEMIRFRGRPFKKVSFVVKGGPIINDATIEDALMAGIDRIPNVKILKVSNGDESTGPDILSEEVRNWLENHDLVLSKGQGNYEDLSEVGTPYFLLMIKCPVIGDNIGVNVGDIVIMRGNKNA